jgi:hypothetical protein
MPDIGEVQPVNPCRTNRASILVLLVICLSAITMVRTQADSKPLAPHSLAGIKMKYKDLHGDYTFTFTADGTYKFTSSREGEKPETRTGRYEWKVMNPEHAVLTLDGNETYKLTFKSTTEATGWVDDDYRPYAFHFEKR